MKKILGRFSSHRHPSTYPVASLVFACLVACSGTPSASSAIASMYATQPNCLGLGDGCDLGSFVNHCCAHMTCWGAAVAPMASCSIQTGFPCDDGSECSSGTCTGGKCACSDLGSGCDGDADCCPGLECNEQHGLSGFCVRPAGAPCQKDDDCVTLSCGSGGQCACGSRNASATQCAATSDCCPGFVCADLDSTGVVRDCTGGPGAPCTGNSDCANGTECSAIDNGVCGLPAGGACASDAECITGACEGGACACGATSAHCVNDGDCCPGEACGGVSSTNHCCVSNGGSCANDSDCCFGSCTSGACE